MPEDEKKHEYPSQVRSQCCLATITLWEEWDSGTNEEPPSQDWVSRCDDCGDDLGLEMDSNGSGYPLPAVCFDLSTRRDADKVGSIVREVRKENEAMHRIVQPLKDVISAVSSIMTQEAS